jgi:hypothetical protein
MYYPKGAYLFLLELAVENPAHTGSPAYLTWKLQVQQRQDFEHKSQQPHPLSLSTWFRQWPKNIPPEDWRSCCCTQCTEVESLIDTWGYEVSSSFCLSRVSHLPLYQPRHDNPSLNGAWKRASGSRHNLAPDFNALQLHWGMPVDNAAELACRCSYSFAVDNALQKQNC